MKAIIPIMALAAIATLFAGCASTPPGTERGPGGTIAYQVQVESSDPGARIGVNNDYIGKTPLTLKIWGDKDGTFHNFGSQDYVVRAYPETQPVRPNQNVPHRTLVFCQGQDPGPDLFRHEPEDQHLFSRSATKAMNP